MGNDTCAWFGVVPSTARVVGSVLEGKKMLRFDHTDTNNVEGILAELGGGVVKMGIKVPKLAEVGWFGYSAINKGRLSVYFYVLHLITEK
jgi:hypothetical protein